MPKHDKGQPQAQAEAQIVELKRSDLLEKFAAVVAEKCAYLAGRKIRSTEMNEDDAVKDASSKAKDATKSVSKALETLVKEPTKEHSEVFLSSKQSLKTAREDVHTTKKPFLEKIKPLTKAIRFIDTIAIPSSLEELGIEVKPRFELSKWCGEALEASKKK